MSETVILCSSARLARSIQQDIARQQQSAGITYWASPNVQTWSEWLQNAIEEALLVGWVSDVPPIPLSNFNEQLLWQEVISRALRNNTFGELFDISGMAGAAVEANRYMVAWNLHLPSEHLAEETRQFLNWQRLFRQRCSELHVLENVRYLDWQLNVLARFPSAAFSSLTVQFAGFDQSAPQEQRLRNLLSQLGAEVREFQTIQLHSAAAEHRQYENEEQECRAAVAWVERQLEHNPDARLAIITPRLSEVRNRLSDLLDDVFYPLSNRPGMAQMQRRYNFSLGTPLARQPIIHSALRLLRCFYTYQLQQSELAELLRSPFWSAGISEADARAQLDAAMREQLPLQFTLSRFADFVRHKLEAGLKLNQLDEHLQAALHVINDKKATAAEWAQHFDTLLNTLAWPGERTINSLEYQATNAWHKAMQSLMGLDVLARKMTGLEAIGYLQQICQNQVFQPETELQPSIQILGIMEALSSPVDGVWCMHMNDHIWPPPARPNPLLPAFIQRQAGLPNADNTVQAAFAAGIHHRLLHSANTLIFSSSCMEGDSELRVSPLMQDIASAQADHALAQTLAETLAQVNQPLMEYVEDRRAPPVQAGEHVRGGTGLLKAQAVCPAWAFYQFRLGARALKTPVAGLDSMTRGSLVHGVLERFWRRHHYADLRDMSAEALMKALDKAVQQTLQAFTAESGVATATMLELEFERLVKLVGEWLAYEKTRNLSFRIIDCEFEKKVQICGIELTLKIDRLHQLEDGGLEFIDYKTGTAPKTKSWGEDRITEPQLPIYAAFYADASERVTGVYFGMVKLADCDYVGACAADFEDEQGKRQHKFENNFDSWPHLLEHWKTAIEAIAQELRDGEASVQYADENELAFCEVMPLLRLPERKLQFERLLEAGNDA